MKKSFLFISAVFLMSSCVIIRQGEVGVKRKLGKVSQNTINSGVKLVNPFTTRIFKVPVQTQNLKVSLDLPTKEGLTVQADISILYHLETEKVPQVFEKIGLNYEEGVILPVFRSVVTDVSSNFFAKDMYIGKGRADIEKAVKVKIEEALEVRGFKIEAVLLKSIRLPKGLSDAIESKLKSEQEAQQMEFILDREKKEAERRTIEAGGIRDANKIITEGLNPLIIQFNYMDVLKKLAESNNAKFIITDGKVPMMINPDTK